LSCLAAVISTLIVRDSTGIGHIMFSEHIRREQIEDTVALSVFNHHNVYHVHAPSPLEHKHPLVQKPRPFAIYWLAGLALSDSLIPSIDERDNSSRD
jgi:hypothetical protein